MVKAKKFNKNKEEIAFDFGTISVPTRWKDLSLQNLSDYLTLAEKKKKKYEEDKEKAEDKLDEHDEKYSITDKDLVELFTDFDMTKWDILPKELYDSIMSRFAFVMTPMEEYEPRNYIVINGKKFIINDKESLKVKEWTDADSVLRNNRFDYPSLLAILCREVTGVKTDNATGLTWEVNEAYDSEFANKIFDARREMFAKLPITEAMPLISYFFVLGAKSKILSRKYSTMNAHRLEEFVESIESSIKSMGCKKWLYPRLMINLKKLKKLAKSIS